MAENTVETVWKLILDEGEAQASENAITRLAATVEDKLGSASVSAIDKTTEAIRAQTDALKEEEAQAGKTGESVKSGAGGGISGTASGLVSKFAGVGRLAGIPVEQVAGIVRAAEGVQQLARAAGLLETASTAAGAASEAAAPGLFASAAGFAAVLLPLAPLIIAIGLVVAALAVLKGADDQRAEDLKKEAELQRSISDEIAAGATTEDIQAKIQALKDRDDLEKKNLDENKKKYDDYIESVRNAAGGLGRFLEPLIRLFGGQENQLAANVDESQKLLDENAKKEAGYQAALERGDTAKNDAKKREDELADARDKAAQETEKAADKAQRDQEAAQRKQEQEAAKQKAAEDKAAADAQRAAEQQAQKEEQINKQRLDAGRKYADALVDIARKTADDAVKALQDLKDKTAEDTLGFQRDISDLSKNFQESEREETIKRGEEEVNDLIQHGRKLESIRSDAFKSEADLLKRRDFLGATRVREAANAQMEAENKAFKDGQDDKSRARAAEDAQQLRELDKARRARLTALQRSNDDAKTAYAHALRDQKNAAVIARREAGIDRDRALKQANEAARALLGINTQMYQGIVQGAQTALRGVQNLVTNNSVVNNNQRSIGAVNINTQLANSQIAPSQIANNTLKVLGQIGYT